MDHLDVWSDLELAPRLNLTMTCKQIHQETELMFHANNTFLFQTRDRTSNYGILENMANWLYELRDRERETIGRIVVCSKLPPAVVNWAWICAGYCDMDFGLEIGQRIDPEKMVENAEGEFVPEFEPWGREDGHFCNKAHFLVVPKQPKKKQRLIYKGELQGSEE